MPELSGLEAVKVLFEQKKNIKVIFLSMFSGEDYIYHCLKSGGSSLLNKDITKTELLNTIEKVFNGEKYFGPDYTKEKIEKFLERYEQKPSKDISSDIGQLSTKETDILILIAEGLTSAEIGESLFISKRTVDTHRIHLMQKLNLKSFPQLMKFAINFAASLKQEK
jgi:two-component system response regulator NreC